MGYIFLFTTDGVHDYLRDEEMLGILAAGFVHAYGLAGEGCWGCHW